MGPSTPPTLWSLVFLFAKLGTVAFGGPAAHIAMLEEEVVGRHKWMNREHFLDLVGATNLIPGPNSTEMAIHVGYIVLGWKGLLAAGTAFILPAAILVSILAFFYREYGTLPEVSALLLGIKAVVLAIILAAVVRLGKSALKNWRLTALTFVIAAGSLLGVNEVLLILGGGLTGMVWLQIHAAGYRLGLVPYFLLLVFQNDAVESAEPSASLWQMGFFFLKVGSVLFGSGYVLVAFLQGGLVHDYGWLTEQQLLDAIAAGQLTPGPVLTTATFIGVFLSGWQGGVVATLGIFLPSFLFVLILNPLIPRMRESAWSARFLDAVNASAVALMGAVLVELGRATLTTFTAWIMALAAAVLILRYNVSGAILVLISAALGFLFL